MRSGAVREDVWKGVSMQGRSGLRSFAASRESVKILDHADAKWFTRGRNAKSDDLIRSRSVISPLPSERNIDYVGLLAGTKAKIMQTKINAIWLAVPLVLSAITYYGGLRQGLSQIDADRKALMAAFKNGQKPYNLDYRNMGNKVGIEAKTKRHFFQLVPIVHNPNDFSVFAQVTSSASSLAGKRNEPDVGVKSIVEIYPGLDAPIYDNPIFIDLKPGDVEEGRLDIVVKYGLAEDKLDKVLRIKGGTMVEMNGDPKKRFMWLPDPDSAKPIGMTGVVLPYDAETETPMEALGDKLRGAKR